MPRTLTLPAVQALMAQATDEVILEFIKIDHADLVSPFYIVNNTEQVTSNGDDYVPFPFYLELPNESQGEPPKASLIVSNIDRSFVAAIRSIASPPTITAFLALSSSPDTAEFGPVDLTVQDISYDAQNIRFGLSYDIFSAEPFPYVTFNPVNFRGLFR